MSSYQIGFQAEELVSKLLAQKGFKIVTRNYRKGTFGEIDIIAEFKGILYIFEVRARADKNARGYPEDTFDHQKSRKFNRIVNYFLQNEGQAYRDFIIMRSFVSVVKDEISTRVKAYLI